jgi:hypothetical protein
MLSRTRNIPYSYIGIESKHQEGQTYLENEVRRSKQAVNRGPTSDAKRQAVIVDSSILFV